MENKKGKPLSSTHIAIISGVIVWPLWFGLLIAVLLFTEVVLAWKGEGPDWIAQLCVIAFFSVGFFLWRVVYGLIATQWGQPNKERPDAADKKRQGFSEK